MVCSKVWAYFTLKMGWLKASAGTNVGPQNIVYLFVPGIHMSSSAPRTQLGHPLDSQTC